MFGDWVESVLQSVCKRVDGEGVCFGGLLILIPSAAGTTINKIINKNYCVSACHAKIRGRQILIYGEYVGVEFDCGLHYVSQSKQKQNHTNKQWIRIQILI